MCDLSPGVVANQNRSENALRIFGVLLSLAGISRCSSFPRRAAIDQDVLAARQLVQQGEDAADRGSWNDAEERFQQAIRVCPENCDARCKYADCLWRRGDQSGAIEQMAEAVKTPGHDDVGRLVTLGDMLLGVNQISSAQRNADMALQRDPRDARSWKLQVDILNRTGEYRAALTSYQRALAYDPQNVELQYAVAQAYHRLQRPRRTLATLDRVDHHRSEMPADVHLLRGLALHQLDRNTEATAALRLAQEKGKTLPPMVMEQIAEAEFARGNFESAIWAAGEAIRAAEPIDRLRCEQLMQRIGDSRTTNSRLARL